MANNKVQLSNGTVLMDTSGVTVSPDVLFKGYTALDKTGKLIVGSAIIKTIYQGGSAPSASIGNDGDVYVQEVT